MEVSPVGPDLGHRSGAAPASSWAVQLRWFALGAVTAFAVPFVFSSLLELPHDVYLAVYFAFVAAFVGAYVNAVGIDARAAVRRNWRWGLAAGVVLGVPIVRNVFTESETARPDGAYFVFELLWRGVTYGAVDAVLLTVVPCLMVFSALGGRLGTWRRRAAYFGASLVAVMTITATYHLGYSQYRDDGVGGPEIGNTMISLPMLLTANPVGSVIDHSAMHVAAVVREYEGDRIPPRTDAD